jgi:hypothetical protein
MRRVRRLGAVLLAGTFVILPGQAAIFAANAAGGGVFLGYNVLGCLAVIGAGMAVSPLRPARR